MKKTSSVLLILAVAFTLLTPLQVSAEKPIEIYLNGQKISLSADPIIENDILFIPFKEVFEKLGFDIYWDDYYEVIDAYGTFTWFEFAPGSNDFYVDDYELEFEAPSKVIQGNTYVPLSFIQTVAGKDVSWDKNSRVIAINDSILDENFISSDAKMVFEKLRKVDIESIKFTGSISINNKEDGTMKRFTNFIDEGEAQFNTKTTRLIGSSYYEFFEMDLDVFITDEQQYRRNFVSGDWLNDNPAFIDFNPMIFFSNLIYDQWEKGIFSLESGLSYDGLNLKITIDPNFYYKNVSPKVTNSPISDIRITFYSMDTKTLIPESISFQLTEKNHDNSVNHSVISFLYIESINEINEIAAPDDLKRLINKK